MKVSFADVNENLYVFIGRPSIYENGYYQVFNKELIAQSKTYHFSDSFKHISEMTPSLISINKKIYAIYVSNENNERFLKITSLSANGDSIRTVYLQKIQGSILDYKPLPDIDNNIRYIYTELVDQKLFYKYITIDLNELNL